MSVTTTCPQCGRHAVTGEGVLCRQCATHFAPVPLPAPRPAAPARGVAERRTASLVQMWISLIVLVGLALLVAAVMANLPAERDGIQIRAITAPLWAAVVIMAGYVICRAVEGMTRDRSRRD